MNEIVLEVKHLSKTFGLKGHFMGQHAKKVCAVNDVSFVVHRGETFGLVGESGCGKSTLARLILSLIKADEGEVWFEGQNILQADRHQLLRMRRDMQMIFQKPYESLNPRMTVRDIVAAPLDIHGMIDKKGRDAKIRSLLDMVGLPSSAMDKYPHEFSGGQRQRIGIARAIALQPKLIICDEPVSALDVSIQAQILNLLVDLQKELQLTYIFISHNLSVIEHISDTVAVMYAGQIVEIAQSTEIYTNPLHPYTQTLLAAVPTMHKNKQLGRMLLNDRSSEVQQEIHGCKLQMRCPLKTDLCEIQEPRFKEIKEMHWAACHIVDHHSDGKAMR